MSFWVRLYHLSILVKISRLIIDKQHYNLKNETSSYQIPPLTLPKKWSDLSFTFPPITPTRFYKDKTKNEEEHMK